MTFPTHRDPANPFVLVTDYGTRKRSEFCDMDFSRALAAELSATLEPGDMGSDPGRIILEGGVWLWARGEHGARIGRVEMHLCPPRDLALKLNGYTVPKLPSFTVDAARPLADIAKRVRKALVEALAAVEVMRAKAVEVDDARAKFLALCQAWREALPGLDIKIGDENRAGLYFNRGGAYLTGTLYPNGSIGLSNVSANSSEAAQAIVRAIMSAAVQS